MRLYLRLLFRGNLQITSHERLFCYTCQLSSTAPNLPFAPLGSTDATLARFNRPSWLFAGEFWMRLNPVIGRNSASLIIEPPQLHFFMNSFQWNSLVSTWTCHAYFQQSSKPQLSQTKLLNHVKTHTSLSLSCKQRYLSFLPACLLYRNTNRHRYHYASSVPA